MTEDAIKRQIETLEKVANEACKSPESARKFIDELEKRVGIPFNEKRAAKLKKRK